MWASSNTRVFHGAHMKVRGQCMGTGSPLPLCGLQGNTQVFRLGDYPASHLGEHAFYVLKQDFHFV